MPLVWVRTVSALRPSVPRPRGGRVAVGVELEDLALAAGQGRAASAQSLGAGSTKRSRFGRRVDGVARAPPTGELLTTYAVAPASIASVAACRSGCGAVGDDAEARLGLAQRPDRRGPGAPRRGGPRSSGTGRRSRRRSRRPRSAARARRPLLGLLDLVAVARAASRTPSLTVGLAIDDQAASVVVHSHSDRRPDPGADSVHGDVNDPFQGGGPGRILAAARRAASEAGSERASLFGGRRSIRYNRPNDDLGHLQVPLRRRRPGRAGPLGRPAGPDRPGRRAPRRCRSSSSSSSSRPCAATACSRASAE